MKNLFLYMSMSLVILCSFISAEDKKPPANIQELQENFVLGFFVGAAEYSKDSTITLKVKMYPEEPEMQAYIGDHCQTTLGAIYTNFQTAIDQKADYSYSSWYGKSFFENYKRLITGNLIKKSVPTKTGSNFNYFDPIAIEKLFQTLYKKPTDKFKGIATYQRLYDASMKNYGIGLADFISKVMRNKKGFDEVTAMYKKDMETSEEFYGMNMPDKSWEKIFPKNELEQSDGYYYYPTKDNECGYGSDFLQMLVRRNVDGSLPALLKCFKQILQDYDKATYNTYKDKF